MQAARRKATPDVATTQPERWAAHKDYAAQYMQAARRKVEAEDDFHPPPLPRAETFAKLSSAYDIRYAKPSTSGYRLQEATTSTNPILRRAEAFTKPSNIRRVLPGEFDSDDESPQRA